jgi:hypothetical protein
MTVRKARTEVRRCGTGSLIVTLTRRRSGDVAPAEVPVVLGVEPGQISALQRAIAEFQPTAVVVVGLDALPYFPAISGPTRIWYAADEWVLHHLSQLQWRPRTMREHLWAASVKGVYERAHRRGGQLASAGTPGRDRDERLPPPLARALAST